MAPALSRELVNVLSSPQTTIGQAADAIEEHVLHRRSKGDSLSEVSSSLSSIEARSPRLAPAIRQAQYATNVPPSDMTVPPASLANASSSPASVLAFLVSQPTPAVQNSRKVILEYVLNREARLRDKKYGNGGKGTLGREGFEEIGARLREIEDGLRGTGPLASPGAEPVSDDELDEARQTSRALILSLRMLLSYFTLPELARQLLCQHPTDAERTLVQHIRRRVAGEGRYNVGRELEYVESLTLNRRPALRPAFRSARARNYLPTRALYPISLPAPSKSACIKLLSAFIREIEVVGPAAASSYMNSPPLSTQEFQSGSAKDTSTNHYRGGSWKGMSGSASPPSPGALSKASYTRPPHDPSPVENYSLELLSEYITREKREYMLKNKWVRTGREQLGKDLADMEMALCVIAKTYPGPQAPTLMPVFLQIRRTFALPPSPLPASVIEPFQDMLPSPPDPDSVALREPTVSSTTATLYVNPRLRDDEALEAIEELLENEREKGLNASISDEKTIAWLNGLVDQVSKRFPDGSYETVFDQARYLASHPRVWPDASTSSAFPGHPLVSAEATGHRRSQSTMTSPEKRHMPRRSGGSSPMSAGMGHMRSASMPMRSSVHSNSSRGSARAPSARTDLSPAHAAADVYGGLSSSRPTSPDLDEHAEENLTSDGESDSLDSEFERRVAPFPQGKVNTSDLSALGIAPSSTMSRNKPPMLSLNSPGPELSLNLEYDPIDPPADATSPASSYGTDGWWNVVSPTSSTSQKSPGQPGATWRDSATSRSSMGVKASTLESQTTQVPPTRLPQPAQIAEVAQEGQLTESPLEMSNPPVPPPKPQLGLTPPGAGRDGSMTPTNGSPNPSHSSNSPITPQLGQSPITPQMGKRTPEMEQNATPRPPPIPPQNPRRARTILPVKTSGMAVTPESSAATNEALAKLEGIQLHDESLAKLEGNSGSGQKQIATPVAVKPSQASQKTSPPSATSTTAPAPPKRQATPEDDLYARLDFVPTDYNPMHKTPVTRPAGPIWPNKPGENDRPRRANTQGPNQASSKGNGGAVWPRRKQSDAGINTADVTSGNGPKSAPLSGPKTSWHSQSQEVSAAEAYDTLGKRPGVNAPAPPRKSVEGSHQDANAGTGAGAGAAGGDAGQSSVKSKINTLIGRGLSRRDKENGERAAIAAQAHAAVQAQVQAQQANVMAGRGNNGPIANNPGKWNRDMVAGIMGPPAARRSS